MFIFKCNLNILTVNLLSSRLCVTEGEVLMIYKMVSETQNLQSKRCFTPNIFLNSRPYHWLLAEGLAPLNYCHIKFALDDIFYVAVFFFR